MTRTEKLYHHLEELEEEFAKSLVVELRKIVKGRPSRFLDRKKPSDTTAPR